MEVKVILTVDDRLEALVDKVLNAIAVKPVAKVEVAQEVKEVEVVQQPLQEEKPKKAKAKKKEEPTPVQVVEEEPSVVAEVVPNEAAEELVNVETIRDEIKKISMKLARAGKSAQIKELSNKYGVVKQSDLDVTQVASYLEELKGIE